MGKLSLKIAWRNLWKAKGFALINLGGLAIGLCAALILLLYVASEWQFNRQFVDAENIYEVKVNLTQGQTRQVSTTDQTPHPMAAAMKAELPGIRDIAAITWPSQVLMVSGQRSLKVQNRLADPDILKVLSYHFLQGDATTAFTKPNAVILTRSTAERLFGITAVVGKPLKFMNFADLTVTGVIEDLPENMSYRFESLVSLNENKGIFPKSPPWDIYSFYTVVSLNKGVDPSKINAGIKDFLRKHDPQSLPTPFLYPLLDSHLYGEFENGKPSGGRIQQVRIFIGLAIGILLIACINFMNLATARAGKRVKEVGIRKTIGATRNSLVAQFLLEAVLMVLMSLALAIVLTEAFLPLFNNLLHTRLDMGVLNVWHWVTLISVILFTGMVSGSYPAFYLSSFAPASTLKSTVRMSSASVTLRKALVVVQFSCAVFLICGTLVIYQQLQFIKNRPTGYDSNLLVEMPIEGQLFQKYDLLKERLLASRVVSAMCKTSASISTQNSVVNGLQWPGMNQADRNINFNQLFTTNDFTVTTGVKIIAGRDFSQQMKSDSTALLLNKTAVKAMGLKDPIGKQVLFAGQQRSVVGIFEDIIWAEPSKTEMPMVVAWGSNLPDRITMRLSEGEDIAGALASISKIAKELNPVYPVELRFVDSLYQQKFESERTLSILANLFGGLSIFISCLGLLGLSAYSAELRTKEIGIRKVLGASDTNIVGLLSWSFVKMVLIAILVTLPLTWLLMNRWLMKFELHVEVSWWLLIVASTVITVIAFLTVSYQAVAAARANPVKALKYE